MPWQSLLTLKVCAATFERIQKLQRNCMNQETSQAQLYNRTFATIPQRQLHITYYLTKFISNRPRQPFSCSAMRPFCRTAEWQNGWTAVQSVGQTNNWHFTGLAGRPNSWMAERMSSILAVRPNGWMAERAKLLPCYRHTTAILPNLPSATDARAAVAARIS